ncbi:cytochrome c biogenesis protein ResB [Jatrophihabitans telluris]|uniref:Cytochrome c biogenesis protein ResB n=1 Tax=Jatrophihabitans telluris TaxID=2038343 RepID=A0ABY4QZD4_9ACTN|nr:cytochrome c biogenesis protein ResB [Jatrophihabitans telluris]UQX88883.1 cytochrome c biogenesis protein ResB [Jatrophihabitans telluris]
MSLTGGVPARLVRQWWRRLISMRTAIVLLFLLALAAVPGSLLPQRPLNEPKVQAYLASHGSWGKVLDRLGAFDVFGSFWFAAVYLLLFVSLIGCLIPRIQVYSRALRAKPLKAPKNLTRLAEHDELRTAQSAEQVAASVTGLLRPRWRTVRREEGDTLTISAEKGYLREAGNLLFHVALLSSLVFIAAGKLYGYQGSIVTTEGNGFCNTVISYDSFKAGRWVDQGAITPFCVDKLNSFTASYRDDGTPSSFRADVTYSDGVNGAAKHDVITVNHPLRLQGDRVYLINHGFAPTVTVKRPGKAAVTDTAPFLPQDTFFTSEGVFKFVGTGKDGKAADLGLKAIFAPTPVDDGNGVISSSSPQVDKPILALLAYQGDSQAGNGIPQSVYALDVSKMTKIAGKNMAVGDSLTLPDGTVITFDGYKQWAAMQVSHDPAQGFLLVAVVLMVLGLLGSLVVRRRRVWLRIIPMADPSTGLMTDAESAPADAPRTLIQVGGLARSDSGNFTTEFEALLARLRQVLSAVPAPGSSDSAVVGAGAGKD